MPYTVPMSFLDGAKCLEKWLERAKLRPTQAAPMLRMHKTYLSGILNGSRRPGLDNAVWIERMTGIPVEAWVSTEDGGMAQPMPGKRCKRIADKVLTAQAAD